MSHFLNHSNLIISNQTVPIKPVLPTNQTVTYITDGLIIFNVDDAVDKTVRIYVGCRHYHKLFQAFPSKHQVYVSIAHGLTIRNVAEGI